MTRIAPMDLSFLLLERANRPYHMAALHDLPKTQGTAVFFRAAPVRRLSAQPGGQALQLQAQMAGQRCRGVGNRRAGHAASRPAH